MLPFFLWLLKQCQFFLLLPHYLDNWGWTQWVWSPLYRIAILPLIKISVWNLKGWGILFPNWLLVPLGWHWGEALKISVWSSDDCSTIQGINRCFVKDPGELPVSFQSFMEGDILCTHSKVSWLWTCLKVLLSLRLVVVNWILFWVLWCKFLCWSLN